MKTQKILFFIIPFLLFSAYFILNTEQQPADISLDERVRSDEDDVVPTYDVYHAFQNKQSDVMVQGEGKVYKLLKDDLKGSKHQRFLVRTAKKQSILIAHNIDLAPRVPLQVGSDVIFRGEYEWNDKGGVVHWTHHAPDKDHPEGWIRFEEKTYK